MPYLPPATAAARTGVRTLLTEQLRAGALRPADLVLVACSGGADSLALAVATAFVAPRLGLRAGAVTVDHGLQPGTGDVGRETVMQCRTLGLDPAWVLTPDGDPHRGHPGSGGPEGRARAIRYDAFEQAVAETGAGAVLLGHTADDQAETVLLGLARGSGTRAMAGMASVRGHYLRPLLAVSRAQTEAVCAEAGLVPWYDPTNAPDGPWRTASGASLPRAAVRAEVLPALTRALGPGVIEALGRTAELAQADADLLDELAGQVLARARVGAASTASTAVLLDVATMADQPTALRTRALRAAALAAGSPPGSLNHGHIRTVDALITDYRGQGPISLPGPVWVARRYGTLVLGATEPTRPER